MGTEGLRPQGVGASGRYAIGLNGIAEENERLFKLVE